MEGTLVWLDVETTGLDPGVDALLQVGIKVGDRTLQREIHYPPHMMRDYFRKHADPVVEAMHVKTGLWDACTVEDAQTGAERLQLDRDIVEFIARLPRPLILSGNSIHFDRRWVIEWLPKFNAELHYRMLDVSALNIAGQLFGFPKRPKPTEPAHTALADIEDSIANLEYWRSLWAGRAVPK